jgi:nucleotide-binding universal stress UspA family protein
MNTQHTRPVVVAADGRPGSHGALRYAVAEAGRRGAPLHVVHVVQTDSLAAAYLPIGPALAVAVTDERAAGESVLSEVTELVHQLAPGLEVSTELRFGGRADSILQVAHDAQLLVVGRETRRGLERVLTGTTTAAVASRAKCDVIVVPSFWSPEHTHGRVVAAIKSRDQAHHLLGVAFTEACARHATLVVVTAWEVPDPHLDRIEVRTRAAEWKTDGEEMLASLLADWRTAYPDVQVLTLVEHGPTADVVLRASEDSDLLLISRRSHGVLAHEHLGGIAHEVLRRSDVAVTVVSFDGSPDELTPDLALEVSGRPLMVATAGPPRTGAADRHSLTLPD